MAMSEEKEGPLVVLAEERPVYIFTNVGEVVCPGDGCPIKKAFVPFGRGIVRVLDGRNAGDDGGLFTFYAQEEEFVVRSCEECRYNPVARAVIDELIHPKVPDGDAHTGSYHYNAKKMYAKIQGLNGLAGLAGAAGSLGNLFKDYMGPGIGTPPPPSQDKENVDDNDPGHYY